MSRIRTVKPEFWKHEILSSLPEPTHMLAAALINYADDDGYFNANPGLIKAECYPLREPSVGVQQSLNSLSKIGYLRFGVGPDGRKYGHIVSFDSHQRINRPTPSKIKDLEIKWDKSPTTHEQLSEDSSPEGKGTGNREQGREASTAVAVPAGKLVCTLPLIDKTDHSVFEADVQEWQALYLAVDVRQELRNLKGWLIGNPKLRKTKSGVGRFINSWLSRAQNEAKPGAVNANRNYSKTGGNLTAAAGAFAILEQAERNSSATDEVQPETGGSGKSGDLSHLRAGSIEL